MSDWALTRADRQGVFEGAGDVGFGVLDGDAERFAEGKVGGNGGAKGASGAVGMLCVYAGVAEDHGGVTRCEDVNASEQSGHTAAFNEDGAAPEIKNFLSRNFHVVEGVDVETTQDLGFVAVGSDEAGARDEVTLEGGDRIVADQTCSGAGHHNRIDDEIRQVEFANSGGNGFDDFKVKQHTGFGGLDADVANDSIHLGNDGFRWERIDAGDAKSILRRDAGERAGAMDKVKCKRPQVGLNSCPAATV